MHLLSDWRYRSMQGPDTAWKNDTSDPQFTVPDREVWQVLSVWHEVYPSEDANLTRVVRLEITDAAGDIMYEQAAGANMVNLDVRCDFLFAPGLPDLTASRDTGNRDLCMTPIPGGLLLGPGWNLGVFITGGDSVDDYDVSSGWDNTVTQLIYASQYAISTAGVTPQTSDN